MNIAERLLAIAPFYPSISKEAVDEIARFKTDNERLRAEHNTLVHHVAGADKEIEQLKAENAKLRHELQVGLTEIARLRAENERLKADIELRRVAARAWCDEIERLKGEHEALRQALFKTVHEQIVWVLQTSAPGLSEQMKQIIADTVIRRVANILTSRRALEEKT